MTIFWEKWEKDLFYLVDNNYYYEKFIKYIKYDNSLSENTFFINNMTNKIYEKNNRGTILNIGTFSYTSINTIIINFNNEIDQTEYLYETLNDTCIEIINIKNTFKLYEKTEFILLTPINNINNSNYDMNLSSLSDSYDSEDSYYDIDFPNIPYNNEFKNNNDVILNKKHRNTLQDALVETFTNHNSIFLSKLDIIKIVIFYIIIIKKT